MNKLKRSHENYLSANRVFLSIDWPCLISRRNAMRRVMRKQDVYYARLLKSYQRPTLELVA